MNEEFKSLKELYNRVRPALYSKLKEIKRLGLGIVEEKDIWNYLVDNSWKKKTNLELHEIISDILYVDNYRIYEYAVNELNKYKEKEELNFDKDELM